MSKDFTAEDSTAEHSTAEQVTLYVVPGCPLCTRARAWLEGRGIEYVERDVMNDFGALRAMYNLTGQRLVPVFATRGRALVRPTETELKALFS